MYHQVSKNFYLSLFLVVAYAAFLNVPCFVDACFVSKKEKETPTYSFYHYVSLLNSKKIVLFSLKNKINHLKNTTKNIFEKTNKKTSTLFCFYYFFESISLSVSFYYTRNSHTVHRTGNRIDIRICKSCDHICGFLR